MSASGPLSGVRVIEVSSYIAAPLGGMTLAQLGAESADVREHTDVYDLEPGHSPAEPRVRRIKAPHKVHPVFEEVVRSPQVIAGTSGANWLVSLR